MSPKRPSESPASSKADDSFSREYALWLALPVEPPAQPCEEDWPARAICEAYENR